MDVKTHTYEARSPWWLSSLTLCALTITLSGCPDPIETIPQSGEMDQDEEDASGFKYDLDLPDMELEEDMTPVEMKSCMFEAGSML